jgi:hypothetical protein
LKSFTWEGELLTTTALDAPKAERIEVARLLGPLDEPGITFTATGLTFQPSVTYEQWAQYGRKLKLAQKGIQWAIGDWINYGEKAYGEKYAQALDETGLSEGTLMNYAAVARAFKTSRRREVDFSTHAEVMGLEQEEQDEILIEAEQNHTPREKVRREVARRKVARGPKPDEGEYIHSKVDREYLDEYMKALNVLDDCAPRVPAFRLMNHAQHGHVLWQRDRTVAGDCEIIQTAIEESEGSIAEDDLFMWLQNRGYFMSDPEFEARLDYMERDDVRMAKRTDAGAGKQEDRRGKLPVIVTRWFNDFKHLNIKRHDDDEAA